MITSIFFFTIGTFLIILASILSAFSLIIPADIQNSFNYVGSFLSNFNGIINMEALRNAVSFYVLFLITWFSFLFIMWVWRRMPFVGKKTE